MIDLFLFQRVLLSLPLCLSELRRRSDLIYRPPENEPIILLGLQSNSISGRPGVPYVAYVDSSRRCETDRPSPRYDTVAQSFSKLPTSVRSDHAP